MRFSLVFAAFLALLIPQPRVHAQNTPVTAEVELDQDQFLPLEDIKVAVRIINLTGRTLHMGADNGWLKFIVETKDGFPVLPESEPAVVGEFDLPTSKTGIKRVNLVPHFPVKQSGRYTVRAEIEVPGLNKAVTSRPVSFDIFNGTVLKSITVGVVRTNAAPGDVGDQRTFLLQRKHNGQADQLYVRLTDQATGNTLKVIPVGRLISIGEPEVQVDQQSRLHVLFRVDSQTFRYVVVTADGEMVRRQTHDYGTGAPKLRMNGENAVVVSGGVRREMSSDIPVSARVEDNGGDKAP